MADKSDRRPAPGGGPQRGAGDAPGTGGAGEPGYRPPSLETSAGWPGSRSPPHWPRRWYCCWLAG